MIENSNERWVQMVPGVRRRTVASGERMMQMLVTLESGSRVPEHQHPHEQVVHVLRGRLRLTVAGQPIELAPGQAYYLAGSVPHAVDALEETLVLDTFSPPREDLLAEDQALEC